MRHWCAKRGPQSLCAALRSLAPKYFSTAVLHFFSNPTLSDHQNQITAKTTHPLLRRHLVFCTRSIAAGIVFRYIPVFDIISLAPVSTICGDTLLHSRKKKLPPRQSFPRHEEAINFDDSHNSTPSASTPRRPLDRTDRI